jgi:hypothetical protein
MSSPGPGVVPFVIMMITETDPTTTPAAMV